jgi:cell division septum initiation protein DivIVA
MMNNREFEQPEFTTSIRGYDRLQVDDYISRLRSLTIEAEERARTAESELEFSRHATIGPRVAEIFDLAVSEAKELRERVSADCERMRAQARGDADNILERARDLAEEIDGDTRRGRAEAIAAVNDARVQAQDELAQIEKSKEAHLADLRKLQEALGMAARLVESGASARALEPTEEVPALTIGESSNGSRAAA